MDIPVSGVDLLASLNTGWGDGMKYKFEFLLCCGVFSAGAVWSRLIFPTDFWKVDSIHDLFEIFGATATLSAVYIAATWKRQLGSTRDYELARKAAVAVLKYKESVVDVWEVADNCLQQETTGEGLDERMRNIVILTTENRLSAAEKLRTELQELIVECRAIWRNGIDRDISRAVAFEEQCANTSKTYLLTIRPQVNPVSAITARYTLIKFKDSFKAKGITSRQEADQFVEKLLGPANGKLDSMMR